MMKVVNKEEFNKVINETDIVIVDFFATWCGPCKMLSPVLEEVAEAKKDEITIIKVDVDDEVELANKYHISSILLLDVNFNTFLKNKVIFSY